MDKLIEAIRNHRENVKRKRCEEIGVDYIATSKKLLFDIDQESKKLLLAQIDTFETVSNVVFIDGIKHININGELKRHNINKS